MSALKEIFVRAEQWPPDVQQDLLRVAQLIEDSQNSDFEDLDENDYAIIAKRMKESAAGQIATDEEVEAVFAKYRP
jgi:predicted transcriptional regulator